MAYCCAYRCFNTPHAWQLGWISVQQVDGASLAPGQTVTATLASQVGREGGKEGALPESGAWRGTATHAARGRHGQAVTRLGSHQDAHTPAPARL